MKKLRMNMRVTELDTTSDVIIRLYKADPAVSKDAYLKTLMAEIEGLSEKITAAIKATGLLRSLTRWTQGATRLSARSELF